MRVFFLGVGNRTRDDYFDLPGIVPDACGCLFRFVAAGYSVSVGALREPLATNMWLLHFRGAAVQISSSGQNETHLPAVVGSRGALVRFPSGGARMGIARVYMCMFR